MAGADMGEVEEPFGSDSLARAPQGALGAVAPRGAARGALRQKLTMNGSGAAPSSTEA